MGVVASLPCLSLPVGPGHVFSHCGHHLGKNRPIAVRQAVLQNEQYLPDDRFQLRLDRPAFLGEIDPVIALVGRVVPAFHIAKGLQLVDGGDRIRFVIQQMIAQALLGLSACGSGQELTIERRAPLTGLPPPRSQEPFVPSTSSDRVKVHNQGTTSHYREGVSAMHTVTAGLFGEPGLTCQPSLGADGTIRVQYQLQVSGSRLYKIADAYLITPHEEIPFVHAQEAGPWKPLLAFQSSLPTMVYGLLEARVPATGGACRIRVRSLVPLGSDGDSDAAITGPWEFSFFLPTDGVEDWHQATPVDYRKALPGGAELRVYRVLRRSSRTVLWQEVIAPGSARMPWLHRHAMPTIESRGACYQGDAYPTAMHQVPREPITDRALPGQPGGPPIHCPVEAVVYGAVSPGPATTLKYHWLEYGVSAPWSVAVSLPPDRPAVVSSPTEFSVAGAAVRLEEVLLGRAATAWFFSAGEVETDGMRAMARPGSPIAIRDASQRVYRPRSGGGDGKLFHHLSEPIGIGVSQVVLSGEGIQLRVEDEITVDLASWGGESAT